MVSQESSEKRKLSLSLNIENEALKKIEQDQSSLKRASSNLELLKQTRLGDTTRFSPRQAINNVGSSTNIPLPDSVCTSLGSTPRTLPRQAAPAFVDISQNVQEEQYSQQRI